MTLTRIADDSATRTSPSPSEVASGNAQMNAPSEIVFPEEHNLIYQVGGVSYFSPTHTAVARLTSSPHDEEFIPIERLPPFPLTVLRMTAPGESQSSGASQSPRKLEHEVQDAIDIDDVLNEAWTSTIVLLSDITEDCQHRVRLEGTEVQQLMDAFPEAEVCIDRRFRLTSDKPLSPRSLNVAVEPNSEVDMSLNGPYLASPDGKGGIDLFPVYRLYPDTQRSFLYGIYKPVQFPSESGATYKMFRKIDDNGDLLIPVPSRLYGKPKTDTKGISGSRMGLKDLFSVKGVVTGGGSKAYAALQGPSERTASALRRLEDLGVVIVGMNTCSEFGQGSRGHADTLGNLYPWSARGDGWQSVVGSTTGGACALSAYPWLDAAVGTDTAGSVRGPAALVGLYGIRPSTGVIPLDGVIPACDWADTVGVMTRDPRLFTAMVRAWMAGFQEPLRHNALPCKLWAPQEYTKQKTEASQAVVDSFLDDVARSLSMLRTDYPIESKLDESGWGPDRIKEVLDALWDTNSLDSLTGVGESFKAMYKAQNGGREPPLDPWVRKKWADAESDKERLQAAYAGNKRMLEDFAECFNRDVLPKNADSGSEGILVYDIGSGGLPVYREAALNDDAIPKSDLGAGSLLSPLAGFVDITVPIGQVPYDSEISGVAEQKAVTVSMAAAKGSDLMLLDVVDKLHEAGLISEVKTGRTPY